MGPGTQIGTPSPSEIIDAEAENESTADPRYARYVLILVAAAFALNSLDRQIINVLAESIKHDLDISDAQLGLLTGTAFGLFYATLGIPIARLADRTNRVSVLAISLFIWSGFTIMCGLVSNFTQLVAARLGVGVGEAGGTPSSISLLSDYFPQDRRTTALAVFSAGWPIGTALGFGIGGYMEHLVGWRGALILAGVPGILLALLIRATVRETRARVRTVEAPPFVPAVRQLLTATFLRTVGGGACAIFVVHVSNAWLPSLFIRLYGMSATQIGLWIAFSVCAGGTVGVLLGGIVTDKLKPRWPEAELWVPAIATAAATVALITLLLVRDRNAALAALFALYTLGSVWMGPTNAIVQRVAPLHSRSLAVGMQLLIGNLFSLGFGPLLVGLLSDHFGVTYGIEGLRYALLSVTAVGFISAILYVTAVPSFRRDIGAPSRIP